MREPPRQKRGWEIAARALWLTQVGGGAQGKGLSVFKSPAHSDSALLVDAVKRKKKGDAAEVPFSLFSGRMLCPLISQRGEGGPFTTKSLKSPVWGLRLNF